MGLDLRRVIDTDFATIERAWVDGMDLAGSETLVDGIWTHATQLAHCLTHHWRVGAPVRWDNRCTMHRRDPFDAASRRIMHRTQIKGGAPPAA